MDGMLPRKTVAVGRELLSAFPAVVVQGARQVGKSTLARQLVEDRTGLVVTLDDRRTRDAAVADETAFVDQCPDGVLVIDEVQREPELLLAIKASIDRDRRPGRFLLTGSADLLTVKGRTDSLAGRAATLRLRGLSQGELAGEPEDFVTALVSETHRHNVSVPPGRGNRMLTRWLGAVSPMSGSSTPGCGTPGWTAISNACWSVTQLCCPQAVRPDD